MIQHFLVNTFENISKKYEEFEKAKRFLTKCLLLNNDALNMPLILIKSTKQNPRNFQGKQIQYLTWKITTKWYDFVLIQNTHTHISYILKR